MAESGSDQLRRVLDTLHLDPDVKADRDYMVSVLRRLGYSDRQIQAHMGIDLGAVDPEPEPRPDVDRIVEVEYLDSDEPVLDYEPVYRAATGEPVDEVAFAVDETGDESHPPDQPEEEADFPSEDEFDLSFLPDDVEPDVTDEPDEVNEDPFEAAPADDWSDYEPPEEELLEFREVEPDMEFGEVVAAPAGDDGPGFQSMEPEAEEPWPEAGDAAEEPGSEESPADDTAWPEDETAEEDAAPEWPAWPDHDAEDFAPGWDEGDAGEEAPVETTFSAEEQAAAPVGPERPRRLRVQVVQAADREEAIRQARAQGLNAVHAVPVTVEAGGQGEAAEHDPETQWAALEEPEAADDAYGEALAEAEEGGAFTYGDYTLHTREVTLNGDRKQRIYFFAKSVPKSGEPCPMPEGYRVGENERTGLPYLVKERD